METMTTSELLELTKQNGEVRKRLYKNPVLIPVSMIVDLDEYGRIKAFGFPGMEEVLGKRLIDDSEWAFKKGETVYHKTLKQVGTFIEVDQLDPSSASVEFQEEDGYKDEKRISLALLTTDIPEEAIIVYQSDNGGGYTKERVMKEIRQWVNQSEDFKHVTEKHVPILCEVIYGNLLPMLDGVVPYTKLVEFDPEDIQEIAVQFKAVSQSE